MLLVGAAVLWAGYALTYFGWESLRGPGVGMLDLVVPGRFKGHASTGAGFTSSKPPPAVTSTKGSTSTGLLPTGTAGGGSTGTGQSGGGAGGGGGGSW